MAPKVVLVTGVSRALGSRVAARLASDESVERVIGVDTVAPKGEMLGVLGRTEFVRADIRNPLIAKVIATAGVDTVVHMNVLATPFGAGGRSSMKEMNVIGTMQLLAACQKAPSMQRLVLRSTTTVYGSSPRDPALFTEDTEPKALPRSGYGKDAVEIEGYVRGFARRRPDVSVAVLRFANFLGPLWDTPLTRYLTLPVVPTVLGYDPRLQFVHVDDGLEVLHRATVESHEGVFNVAGPGTLLLSQAVRRAGRVALPLPEGATATIGSFVRRSGLVDFSPEQARFLAHGRVVDISRLRDVIGYEPKFTTPAAFDDFVRSRDLASVLSPENVATAERTVLGWIARARRTVRA
jgi:UDP-glucose 4-epimerase